MDINLPNGDPVIQDTLTEGGFYSVFAKPSNAATGKVIVEAEVAANDWQSIGETSGFIAISALPGTRLRFTLSGSSTGKIRLTKSA